jgi:hypothetical protein
MSVEINGRPATPRDVGTRIIREKSRREIAEYFPPRKSLFLNDHFFRNTSGEMP